MRHRNKMPILCLFLTKSPGSLVLPCFFDIFQFSFFCNNSPFSPYESTLVPDTLWIIVHVLRKLQEAYICQCFIRLSGKENGLQEQYKRVLSDSLINQAGGLLYLMIEKQEHYLISVKRHGIHAVKRKRSRQMIRQWLILLILLILLLLILLFAPANGCHMLSNIMRLLCPADLYLIA